MLFVDHTLVDVLFFSFYFICRRLLKCSKTKAYSTRRTRRTLGYSLCMFSGVIGCPSLLTMTLFMNSGDFADALGEDYLGLRELGIAAEFGMSSLSIPKKLLRGKKAQSKLSSAA